MNILYKTLLNRELKRLARKKFARGEPLSILDDIVFKAVFSSDTEDSNEALRLLLSACTKREVSAVRIMNNELLPAYLGAKSPRLDIHVTFNDGEIANLEMQVGQSDDDLKKRSALYSAGLLYGQSKKGEPYKDLKRVYQIFFLNCVLFPQSDKLPRRYFYMEAEEHDVLTEVTEIIFYELPKLERKLKDYLCGNDGMESLSDEEKWCIYFRYRYEEQAKPLIEKLCGEEKGIMRAERALKKVDKDYIKFARELAKVKDRIDMAYAIERAIPKAMEIVMPKAMEIAMPKAMEIAMEKAKQIVYTEAQSKGLAKGKDEGKAEASLDIARKLKACGRPFAEITNVTGLSIKDIEKL